MVKNKIIISLLLMSIFCIIYVSAEVPLNYSFYDSFDNGIVSENGWYGDFLLYQESGGYLVTNYNNANLYNDFSDLDLNDYNIQVVTKRRAGAGGSPEGSIYFGGIRFQTASTTAYFRLNGTLIWSSAYNQYADNKFQVIKNGSNGTFLFNEVVVSSFNIYNNINFSNIIMDLDSSIGMVNITGVSYVDCIDEWEVDDNSCLENNTRLISYSNTNNCSETYNLPFDNNTYESCVYCEDIWESVDSECSINNTRFISYIETNSCSNTFNLPSDNNTYDSCNYCSAEMVQIVDDICTFNGTAYTTKESYVDNNFYGCCAITNIPSDCPTLYPPYDEQLETFCVSKVEDFELDLDENVYFAPFVEDKIWAKIWLNDTTQNYSCISYVKTLDGYNLNTRDIVQVNPDYNKKEKALFSMTSNEYEEDEYFMTNRGLGTAYFTKENLILDGRPYLFGIECSGSVDKVKMTSEKVGYANWKFLNEPMTRFQWMKGETTGMLLGFIILFVIITIIGFVIYRIKG